MCTRRAGKTMMWPRYCTITALKYPGSLIRVWGITRLRAKQLLWDEFIDVAARHKIKIKFHETEAWIKFDNGSEIRFLGADKLKEAEKKRGDKTRMEVVLEAQLFGPYLRTLIEDIAEPCLSDLQGTMCLEGTPGPVPTGYWYAITGSEEAQKNDLARWDSEGRLQSTGNLSDSGEEIKETVGAGGASITGATSTTHSSPTRGGTWRSSRSAASGMTITLPTCANGSAGGLSITASSSTSSTRAETRSRSRRSSRGGRAGSTCSGGTLATLTTWPSSRGAGTRHLVTFTKRRAGRSLEPPKRRSSRRSRSGRSSASTSWRRWPTPKAAERSPSST
jgi:hypothetical protein